LQVLCFPALDEILAGPIAIRIAIPYTARVVRVNNDDSSDIIVYVLLFPTRITFAPDGVFYISNTGFDPTKEELLKFTFN